MKVCVFGASGYLGSDVYQLLKDDPRIETAGTYLEDPGELTDLHKLDINEPESFSGFYKTMQPDVVVWCATSGSGEHELINEGLLHLLAHLTPETKLVYLSTDFVFTDGKGPYTEEDSTGKLPDEHRWSTYANAKVKSERLIAKELTNYAILRAGPIYGKNRRGKRDKRTNKMMEALHQGKTVAYRDDLVRTFVHVRDLAEAVKAFATNDWQGIYHVGPRQQASYYAFMHRMASQLGYSTERLEKASENEFPDEEIPKNTGLITEKIAKETNLHFRPLP
ncbi:NAD-dependent epimerase/dehydratase family protein [Lentibacillus lipolyticus]|nr:NAD-dependent epimerase/dehydratase family protein [Lentibacillus lipolyticus]